MARTKRSTHPRRRKKRPAHASLRVKHGVAALKHKIAAVRKELEAGRLYAQADVFEPKLWNGTVQCAHCHSTRWEPTEYAQRRWRQQREREREAAARARVRQWPCPAGQDAASAAARANHEGLAIAGRACPAGGVPKWSYMGAASYSRFLQGVASRLRLVSGNRVRQNPDLARAPIPLDAALRPCPGASLGGCVL